MTSGLNRRQALTGVAVAGTVVPLLAACGDNNSSSSTSGGGGAPSSQGGGPSQGGSSQGGSAQVVAKTADVPVGGGEILASANLVITQPTQGEFKAFSATCTHQGCTLASVSGGTINCGCHGSRFSIKDGSNVAGPSGSPAGSVAALQEFKVKVQGSDIVRG